ncbi:MAG: hypothetical protein AAF674_16820 [Pseudomonadota bacterium]
MSFDSTTEIGQPHVTSGDLVRIAADLTDEMNDRLGRYHYGSYFPRVEFIGLAIADSACPPNTPPKVHTDLIRLVFQLQQTHRDFPAQRAQLLDRIEEMACTMARAERAADDAAWDEIGHGEECGAPRPGPENPFSSAANGTFNARAL